VNYLIDTNIILEILLDQDKSEECKKFLNNNSSTIWLSDFSLHSLGVILLGRCKKPEIYKSFIENTLDKFLITSLSLSMSSISREITLFMEQNKLDYDDSYQCLIAKFYGLTIVTLDKDFEKIKDKIEVIFL